MFMGKNATLFAVANAVVFCVVVSKSPFVTTEHNDSISAEGCNCGPNSSGCELQKNGTQVCQCNYLYRQIEKTCKAFCQQDNHCNNGGKCVEESCQCLPGTSGDFCKNVDGCAGDKGRDLCGDPPDPLDPKVKAICVYDPKTHEPYCECTNIEYLYYSENRTCIECYCGFGNCTLVGGQKTCECHEGSALKQYQYNGEIHEMCKECECGNSSNGCSFEGLDNKICNCANGTAQQTDLHGGFCNECNCGENGVCFFEKDVKKCICEPGFAFREDSCKANAQDKGMTGGTIALIVLGVLIGACGIAAVVVILRRRYSKASHPGAEIPFGQM